MALPIVKADLVIRVGSAEVTRFSRSSDSNVDSAIEQAWSKFRSAALNVFTADSIDALTSATLPKEAYSHIVSDAVEILSSGQARSTDIDAKAEEARQWRSWLAGESKGVVAIFDDVLTRLTSATGGAIARVGAPSSRAFDPDDECGGLRQRLVRI